MCSNSSGRSERLLKLADSLRVSNTPKAPVTQNGKKRAAVLICLFEDDKGDIRVILTKRSPALSSYTGEVSLPGGGMEKGDENDASTALREANEEIGLDPSLVQVVTVLEPITAKRDIAVYPVIGILWDKNAFKPVLNAAEVESMFDVPLEMFLMNENHIVEQHEWLGYNYSFHFFHYEADQNYIIWGLTAVLLIEAASIVYQRPPDFENSQPKFWGRSRC